MTSGCEFLHSGDDDRPAGDIQAGWQRNKEMHVKVVPHGLHIYFLGNTQKEVVFSHFGKEHTVSLLCVPATWTASPWIVNPVWPGRPGQPWTNDISSWLWEALLSQRNQSPLPWQRDINLSGMSFCICCISPLHSPFPSLKLLHWKSSLLNDHLFEFRHNRACLRPWSVAWVVNCFSLCSGQIGKGLYFQIKSGTCETTSD